MGIKIQPHPLREALLTWGYIVPPFHTKPIYLAVNQGKRERTKFGEDYCRFFCWYAEGGSSHQPADESKLKV